METVLWKNRRQLLRQIFRHAGIISAVSVYKIRILMQREMQHARRLYGGVLCHHHGNTKYFPQNNGKPSHFRSHLGMNNVRAKGLHNPPHGLKHIKSVSDLILQLIGRT